MQSGRGRQVLRILSTYALIVLACVLAITSAVTFWTDAVVLDTDGYLRAVAPVWRQPAIRETAAEQIGQRIAKRMDGQAAALSALPMATASQSAAVTRRVRSLIPFIARGMAEEYVASPSFEGVWRQLNESAQASVVAQLLSPGDEISREVTVGVDLSGPAVQAANALLGVSMTRTSVSRLDKRVTLLEPHEFAAIRVLLRALHGRAVLVLLLAIAAMLAGVATARDRVRALLVGALGIVLGVAFAGGLISVVRRYVVHRMSDWSLSPAFVQEMYDSVTAPLYQLLGMVAVGGLVLGLAVMGASRLRSSRAASPAGDPARG
jgi:hypothetical protein